MEQSSEMRLPSAKRRCIDLRCLLDCDSDLFLLKVLFCFANINTKFDLSLFEQNRAIFMFRIDSEHVVDATCSGGLAR